MLALLAAPANNDRSPRYMEKALAAIHQALEPGERITLRYEVEASRLQLCVQFPEHRKLAILGPLVANYPRAQIEIREDGGGEQQSAWNMDIHLEPDLFPILRHGQFEDMLTHSYADPIDSLLQALRPEDDVQCLLELNVTPASFRRCQRAKESLLLLERSLFIHHWWLGEWFARQVTLERRSLRAWFLARLASASAAPHREAPLDTTSGYRHEREADLQAAADKLGGHVYSVQLRVIAEGYDPARIQARLHAVVGSLGAFTRSRLATFETSAIQHGNAEKPRKTFLLSHEELATLWHPPTAGVEAEGMQSALFTELEAPPNLPTGGEDGAATVGMTRYRNDRRMIGLKREDRRRHVHIIGRTGVGKTTLLLGQLQSDIAHGEGVGLIDPHGDLADSVLKLIPRHRTNDVIVFDAADPAYAIAFNPLACPDPERIDLVTSGAVSAIKKLYDSWGPRLENTLRNAIYVTVEQQGTLLTLLRFLTEDPYRERIVPTIRDEVVRAFWQQEFANWTKPYRTEAVAAITNKIQPFLTNKHVRAIVSQAGRSLDLRCAMDEGKIFIANLSKGKVGEDNSALLGAFLVTAIQQAAMTRADVPEAERRDFNLYIDEFQNFVTTSFETILSEARKYRLNLTVSHQYLAQLNESTAAAIAGNIGTMLSFAVGSTDAEWLANAMTTAPGQLEPRDLSNLPKYTAYARLLMDGVPTKPFSVSTLPPPIVSEDRSRIVLDHSRRQYGRPLEVT